MGLSHRIVQSEAAVRADNERMKAEIDRLRADCNRLRAKVGEPALEPVKAHANAIAASRSFTAGDCNVTIQAKPGQAGTPAGVNPAAATARSQVARAPLRVSMQQGAEPANVANKLAALAPPPPAGATEQGVETDDLAQRVSLLEMK